MTDNTPQKRIATERQTADYLGCSPATVRQSRWNGRLFGLPAPKHMKIGRSIRYDLNEIDAWLESAAKEGASHG